MHSPFLRLIIVIFVLSMIFLVIVTDPHLIDIANWEIFQ